MTFNEFKLICICFCRKYQGKTFGEIFEDVVPSLKNVKITLTNIHYGITLFRIDGHTIFDLVGGKIQYIQHVKNDDKITARWSNVDMSLFDFEDII